jgi:aminoglycoside phosphotransferase (APT) family kinase protein
VVNYSLVKSAADALGDRQLAREAQWLRELAQVRELDGQVPRLLDEGVNEEGRRFLVMSVAQGTGETRAFTPGHERFLASLGKARFRSIDFEVSGCCEQLNQSLLELEGCVSANALATLRAAYHDCETALLYWTGPYVLSQGDFAPWNIRTLGSQLFVYDWGKARTEASPLDDVLHYVMIQRALHGRAVTAAFLQSAMKRAYDFALLAYPEWTWRPPVIGALTLVYLLGALLHHSVPARRLDRADPLVKSYWNLIEKRSAWMPSNH